MSSCLSERKNENERSGGKEIERRNRKLKILNCHASSNPRQDYGIIYLCEVGV